MIRVSRFFYILFNTGKNTIGMVRKSWGNRLTQIQFKRKIQFRTRSNPSHALQWLFFRRKKCRRTDDTNVFETAKHLFNVSVLCLLFSLTRPPKTPCTRSVVDVCCLRGRTRRRGERRDRRTVSRLLGFGSKK